MMKKLVALAIFLILVYPAFAQWLTRHAVNTENGIAEWEYTHTGVGRLQCVMVSFEESVANTSAVYLVTTTSGVITTNQLFGGGAVAFRTGLWNSDGAGFVLFSGDRVRVENDNTDAARVTIIYSGN